MFRFLRNIIVLGILALLVYFARFGVRYVYPLEHYDLITAAAQKYALEEAFIAAVIHTESRFDAAAVSPKGASGLMQLMPSTADWGAEELSLEGYSYDNIFEPALNIELGAWYLRKLLNQFENDTTLALAAYNGGSGNVAKWLADAATSQDGRTLDNIPFKETADYVLKVGRTQKVYEVLIYVKGYIY